MSDLDDETLDPRVAQKLSLSQSSVRVVFDGGQARPADRGMTLTKGKTAVGRTCTDGLLLEDPRASRHHADIEWDGAKLRVINHSRFSTFVNGEAIGDPGADRALADGDVVRIGESLLVARTRAADLRPTDDPMVGRSPEIGEVRRSIALLAPTHSAVLILGPSGAGKEVTARRLHSQSGRTGEFVALNCAGIPEGLAESELFGHRQGAFTGAKRDHDGMFVRAHRGTLFLDELGELPLTLQPKLLRVLEHGEVTPVGGSRSTSVDVRLVAATNRDLIQEVEAGRFRGDLYARVAEMTIRLPALAARREDVLILLDLFFKRQGENPKMTAALAEALVLHPWPFNVREVEKVASELLLRGREETVLGLELIEHRLAETRGLARLRTDVVTSKSQSVSSGSNPTDGAPAQAGSVNSPKIERPLPTREELVAMLTTHRGVIAFVARDTGRSRKQVYRWMAKFELDAADFRDDEV